MMLREVAAEHPKTSNASLWLIGVAALTAMPIFGGGSILAFEVFVIVFGWTAFFAITRENSVLRWVWLLAFLWSAAQIVSNISHGQYYVSSLMYAGPMIATVATGLFWLRGRFAISTSALMVAVGVGWLVLEIGASEILSNSANPWKYGLSTPVAIIALALVNRRRVSKVPTVAVLMVLAVISLIYDSRLQTALFLVCALAVTLTTSQGITRGGSRGLVAMVGLGLIVGGVYWAYPSAALSGALGQRAYQQQVSYETDGSNYVLATRKEFPQMAYLVSQNATLGIGSYAQLDREQRADALAFVNDNIAPLTETDRNYLTSAASTNTGYRAHSAAMSSALYAGVLSLPFWIFILIQNLRGIRRFVQGSTVVPALTLYLCLLTTWDAFFSPITNRTHLTIGVTLFLLAVTFDAAKPAAQRAVPTTELSTER